MRPGAFPMADHHGSTSGRSSPGFGDDPEMMDSSAAFGTPSHLAYSSFSHIGDVQNLSFAVGLREDEEHAELYVQKILPMCKIVPGKPLEKRKRTTATVDVDVDAIEVPEIIEMRNRLKEILRGCDKMEVEEAQVVEALGTASEKLEMVEKRSSQIDEQLDGLNEQLMEERNRSMVASMDAEQTKAMHKELCEQVSISEVAITKLESELADKRRQLQALEECSDLEMVFGRRHAPQKEDLDLSREVAKLEDWKLPPGKAERRKLKSAQAATRSHDFDVAATKLALGSYAERMGQFKRKLRVNDGQWKTGAELRKK